MALAERNSQCWFSGHASLLPDHPVRCENQLDGRSPDLRVAALPRSFPAHQGQWLIPGLLTAYSCGGSNGFGASTALPHRIPFSSRTRALRTETVGPTIFRANAGVKGIPLHLTQCPAMEGWPRELRSEAHRLQPPSSFRRCSCALQGMFAPGLNHRATSMRFQPKPVNLLIRGQHGQSF